MGNKHSVEEYLEIIQGTSVVQHDVLSGNIGFMGLDFFTISYKFVANVSISLVFVFKCNTIINI